MEELSEEYCCPITNSLMEDPVMTKYGHSYERAAITEWLSQRSTDPLTNKPLTLADLFPNRALKNLIDAKRNGLSKQRPVPIAAGHAAVESKEESAVLSAKIYVDDNSEYQLIEIIPPAEREPAPMAVVLVIDVSGSMRSPVSVKNESGEETSDGFSQLDLVKHAARTIIHSLREVDSLSLITYSDIANEVFPLQKMDEYNKKDAARTVESLRAAGGTNIWSGMLKSLQLMDNVNSQVYKNKQVLLLTDGEPTSSPPRGEAKSLETYIPLSCSFNTFGFGYRLKSEMLQQVACVGQGSFAFIPDGGFVGTAFINSMAHLMQIVARDVQVEVTVSEDVSDEVCPYIRSKDGKIIHVGNVAAGQSQFLVMKRSKSQPEIRYNDFQSVRAIRDVEVLENQGDMLKMHVSILKAVTLVSSAPAKMLSGMKDIESAIEELKSLSCGNEYTRDLLVDICGQMSEAFSKQEWLNRWGLHYVRAISMAHMQRVCINFKDPGLQHYGGNGFRKLRDQFEKLFLSIEPPKPSRKAPPPSVNVPQDNFACMSMSRYLDTRSVCFSGSTKIQLADCSWKNFSDLRQGDIVKTEQSTSIVRCIVKTKLRYPLDMVKIGSIEITPWHPMRSNSGKWAFPGDMYPVTRMSLDAVYNVLLESEHSIIVGDNVQKVACITLAHGNSEDEVLKHPYFGTEKIDEDLQKCPGWDCGVVVIESCNIMTNPETGLIDKILPSPVLSSA